ncbi:MAG: DEAD/DEAH box helicase family protein [Lachnospiraceae bacterium]|nr:DEAD/DEAH box helicase family protein [Lachnospiraceae bacterium]
MEKITVTEKIGNEYMQWGPLSKVFISAPTGSGKTYFVLHKLLPYVKQTNQRILYLVNRTILKEQLNRELSLLPSDVSWRVQIELYQTIENYILDKKEKELSEMANEHNYVVCDECHYFLADSNYNTNTCLSFQWIQDKFYKRIRVFMSATIENIREYIYEQDVKAQHQCTEIYKLQSVYTEFQQYFLKKPLEYTLERCYDYLNVNIITTRERVIDLVCDGNAKWLIFVDSIPFGKELCKKIKKRFRELCRSQKETDEDCKEYKKDVVFLSSGYRREGGDPEEEVQVIKKDNVQSARILIATSVMDNGINLKDERLNNVIVFADNETEFIQMLGRKREDGNQVNLYIFKWEKEHFDRRRDQLIRKEQVALDYKKHLKEEETNIIDSDYSGQINWVKSNDNEECFVKKQHKRLLKRLINEEGAYDKIRMAFYAKEGYLYLNLLSVKQMDKLKDFYNDIIEKFNCEGEDAILREQLQWLGKDEKEIKGIIDQSKITEETRIRQAVCEVIDKVIDTAMTKMEAVDLKNMVSDDLRLLVHLCQDSSDKDTSDKDTVEMNLKKNDRPISDKNMDYLRENCKLPYRVEKRKDGEKQCQYVFRRAEQ